MQPTSPYLRDLNPEGPAGPGFAVSPDKRVRLLVYGGYLLATALFHFVYLRYSSYMWGYMGLTGDLDAVRLIAGMTFLAIYLVYLPKDRGPRAFFLHCFALLYLMPGLSLFAYNTFPTHSFMIIVIAAITLRVASAIPVDLPVRRSLSLRVYAFGTVGVTGLLIAVLVFIGGLNTFNLDFQQVYSFRDEAAENLPPIFGYIIPIFTKTVIPFGIAAALHYRYRNFAVVLILASIIIFGITSHKIMLFAPILVAITYLAIKRLNPLITLVSGTVVILAAIAVAVMLNDVLPVTSLWGWVESLFMWRSMILPAYLDYEHITFFSDNVKYYWSASQVTFGLFDAPYNGVQIPQVIGLAVFNDPTMVANAGFVGNGFAQAGLVGVLLYATGIGLILSFFDTVARIFGSPFVISATLTLVLTMLVSADFLSMFLTHGLLLGLLLLLFLAPAGGVVPSVGAGAGVSSRSHKVS